jgi:hypothetical protein
MPKRRAVIAAIALPPFLVGCASARVGAPSQGFNLPDGEVEAAQVFVVEDVRDVWPDSVALIDGVRLGDKAFSPSPLAFIGSELSKAVLAHVQNAELDANLRRATLKLSRFDAHIRLGGSTMSGAWQNGPPGLQLVEALMMEASRQSFVELHIAISVNGAEYKDGYSGPYDVVPTSHTFLSPAAHVVRRIVDRVAQDLPR